MSAKQQSSKAAQTGLFSRLLDNIANKKSICSISCMGDATNALFRYNLSEVNAGGDAYG